MIKNELAGEGRELLPIFESLQTKRVRAGNSLPPDCAPYFYPDPYAISAFSLILLKFFSTILNY